MRSPFSGTAVLDGVIIHIELFSILVGCVVLSCQKSVPSHHAVWWTLGVAALRDLFYSLPAPVS